MNRCNATVGFETESTDEDRFLSGSCLCCSQNGQRAIKLSSRDLDLLKYLRWVAKQDQSEELYEQDSIDSDLSQE